MRMLKICIMTYMNFNMEKNMIERVLHDSI